jgi:hypothetical protein
LTEGQRASLVRLAPDVSLVDAAIITRNLTERVCCADCLRKATNERARGRLIVVQSGLLGRRGGFGLF